MKEVGGKHFLNETSTVFWDYADIDELSVLDLPGIYAVCGGTIKDPKFFWKSPCNDAMSEIANEENILSMSIAANDEGRVIELYDFSVNDLEDILDSEVEEMEVASLIRKGENGAGDDMLSDSDYHEYEDNDYL
ncbi:unnamed protein product [Linum trigynum]|uniref:Uncharacterized protein n=1 Tax=Linum trigynum TaxID=586398 RepID=A0AAV2F2B3_9ROSI